MGSKLQNMIILSYRWSIAFQIQVGHQIHWMTLVLLKSREHIKVIHWILFVDSNVFLWAFFGYVCISHSCSEGKQATTEWWLDLHKIEMFWSAEGAQFMEGGGGRCGAGMWGMGGIQQSHPFPGLHLSHTRPPRSHLWWLTANIFWTTKTIRRVLLHPCYFPWTWSSVLMQWEHDLSS